MKLLMLACLLVIFNCNFANAYCVKYKDGSAKQIEADNKIIGKAAFIGLLHINDVEISDRDTYSPDPNKTYKKRFYEVDATPIQAYVGELPATISFEVEAGFERVGPGKKGQIIERIIFKNPDGSFETTGQCLFLSPVSMALLRQKAPDTPALSLMREKCKADGGELGIDNNYPAHCFYPSGDGGDSCIEDVECEGVCVANVPQLTWIQDARLSLATEWKDAKEFEITSGHCSKWKNPKGCFAEFNGAKVKQTCVKY